MTLIATAVRLAENPNIPGTGVTPKCTVGPCSLATEGLANVLWYIAIALVVVLAIALFSTAAAFLGKDKEKSPSGPLKAVLASIIVLALIYGLGTWVDGSVGWVANRL